MKIGIIGCGRVSQRHIDSICLNNDLKLKYVCDIIKQRANDAALKSGSKAVYDYKDLIDLDIISILTPSGLHPEHTLDVAKYTDAPYIVVEKPISLTYREAEHLFNEVSSLGKTILPVYQNRYNPIIENLKTLVNSGKLGKIYHFVCNVLWNRNDEYFQIDWHGTRDMDGGVLYTQASHYIDMVHYLFGNISEYKGMGGSLRKLEVFDTVVTAIRFENGIVGTLNATVNTYPGNFLTEFTLIAEKGTIRLSGTNLNEITHWDVKGVDKPDLEFELSHQYGTGHNQLYRYITEKRWDKFPSKEEVLSGIKLMERVSYWGE